MPLELLEPEGQAYPGAAEHPVQLLAVPCVAVYEPPGQKVQMDEPRLEKEPGGHVKHVESLVAFTLALYVPAMHICGAEEPLGQNAPGTQDKGWDESPGQ